MTQSTQAQQDKSKYLIYGTIALLIINFILLFLPFIEVYQPSYSKTVLGVTTYEGWYTQLAPMVMFIFPAFLTGIPYLCSINSVSTSFRKKNNKNSFFKIMNNTVEKPIKFFWLKFASIANCFAMWIVYSMLKDEVGYLEKHGAYCHLTFFGILNIVCTVVFIVLLFILSRKTKTMFTLVNKDQISITDNQAIEENSIKEIEQ